MIPFCIEDRIYLFLITVAFIVIGGLREYLEPFWDMTCGTIYSEMVLYV